VGTFPFSRSLGVPLSVCLAFACALSAFEAVPSMIGGALGALFTNLYHTHHINTTPYICALICQQGLPHHLLGYLPQSQSGISTCLESCTNILPLLASNETWLVACRTLSATGHNESLYNTSTDLPIATAIPTAAPPLAAITAQCTPPYL